MFDDIEADHDAELEEEKITFLRREAYAVRDCFTRYSVYILVASGALIVAIARFQEDGGVYIGLMGFFPTLLIFLSLTMGVHKFGTSNRILGFELHLQRMAHYPRHGTCHELMKTVGWEEAMRASRFVTPTLFAAIYWPRHPFFRRLGPLFIRPSIKKIFDGNTTKGCWFDQALSVKLFKKENPSLFKHIQHNAGGYLKTIISIFTVSILICLIVTAIVVVNAWHHYLAKQDTMINLSVVIFAVGLTALMFGAWLNIYHRVKILESGLLSIHSSGIVWEATVLAHLCALKELHFYDRNPVNPPSMHGYTKTIAKIAAEISTKLENIHEWIEQKRQQLN